MNPFCVVLHRPSILAQHPHAEYFASAEFQERMKFEGEAGRADRVRATVYMLSQCALDPREQSEGTLLALERGLVMPELFGVSNPVGIYELPAGQDRDTIRAAIKANLNSKMYKAAQRVLKWRQRYPLRQRHESAVADRLRATLDWPTVADFKQDRQAAQKRQDAVIVQMNVHLAGVRDLRNTRLAALARGAAPGVRSWTEFVADIAAAAFCPQ